MQLTAKSFVRLPRCRGPEHDFTLLPPWAAKHCLFTLVLAAAAVDDRQAYRTLNAVAASLGVPLVALQTNRDCAAASTRDTSAEPRSSSPSSSISAGPAPSTLLRNARTVADRLLETHTVEQCHGVCAVAADMLPAYAEVVARQTPITGPVHEESHGVNHSGEAIGQVRNTENRLLQSQDDDRLKDARQSRILNMADLSPEQDRRFDEINWHGLKTARTLGAADLLHWF